MDLIEHLQKTVMCHQSARELSRSLAQTHKPEALRHAAASELALRGRALLDIDGQSAIRSLVATLADADEELAVRAADALADMGESVSPALFEIERHPLADPHGLAFDLLELSGEWTLIPRVRKCPSGRKMRQALFEFDWHYRGMALSQPSSFSGACFAVDGRKYAVEWVAALATGVPAHLLAATGENLIQWLSSHPEYPPIGDIAES